MLQKLSHMFDDVGEKIKSVAAGSTVLGFVLVVIAAVFGWFALFASAVVNAENPIAAGFAILFFYPIPAIIAVVIACISIWLSFLPLYGFGQLIVNTTPAESKPAKKEEKLASEVKVKTKAPQPKPAKRTPLLADDDFIDVRCPFCGATQYFHKDTKVAYCMECEKEIHIAPAKSELEVELEEIVNLEEGQKMCLGCGEILPVATIRCSCGCKEFRNAKL